MLIKSGLRMTAVMSVQFPRGNLQAGNKGKMDLGGLAPPAPRVQGECSAAARTMAPRFGAPFTKRRNCRRPHSRSANPASLMKSAEGFKMPVPHRYLSGPVAQKTFWKKVLSKTDSRSLRNLVERRTFNQGKTAILGAFPEDGNPPAEGSNPSRPVPFLPSRIVIEVELPGVGPQAHGVYLPMALVVQPDVYDVPGEHVA